MYWPVAMSHPRLGRLIDKLTREQVDAGVGVVDDVPDGTRLCPLAERAATPVSEMNTAVADSST
jgi:hypothetical protein